MASKLLPHAVAEIEQARVAAIDDFSRTCAFPGHEALIAKMKADGHSTIGDVAQAVVAAERTARAAAASTRPTGAGAVTDRFPDLEAVERSALSTWASDAAVRREFRGDRASYVALRKAEAKGQVRPRRA